MKIRKLFFLSLIAALVMSLSLAVACGDDDDDDDDNDNPSDDDDDDGDATAALADAESDCVDFYANACGLDEATAADTCELWLDAYATIEGYDVACLTAAFDALWECAGTSCDDLVNCMMDFTDDVIACY
jgi:hypothetical protein